MEIENDNFIYFQRSVATKKVPTERDKKEKEKAMYNLCKYNKLTSIWNDTSIGQKISKENHEDTERKKAKESQRKSEMKRGAEMERKPLFSTVKRIKKQMKVENI